MTPLRNQQVSMVKQALFGVPEGMTRHELRVALDMRLSDKQLLAVLNTMGSHDLVFRVRRGPSIYYVLATENLPPSELPRKAAQMRPRDVLINDHARARAAHAGIAWAIPPAAGGNAGAETVEQWMARTGRSPEILPHNFDAPRTSFPGRRPVVTTHARNS